ncbi:MAG: diaminopimelate decarboxylase [Anaerolineales bacterium]
MTPFTYTNASLHCDTIPLAALAAEFGAPLYVYSVQRLRENVARLQEAFAALDPLICFAVKANDNLAILRLFRELGLGFDVVSGGELHRVQRAGADAGRIVFAGAGKTDVELAAAVRAGLGWISVESADELRALDRIAGALGRTQRALLRLNPDVAPDTHHHIVTGSAASKFGLAPSDAHALRKADAPHVELCGVHIHIGSQLPGPRATVAALDVALDFLADCPPAWDTLDLGGGFPVAYESEIPSASFADFAGPIAARLARFPRPLRLLLEPGRSLVADAGALLVRAQAVKQTADARTIIVDGGMNVLLRPALYDAYHRVLPVQESDADAATTHVAGPICESADYLARDRQLPALARGDLLAVLHAGAYGYAMASNYNGQPRPAEVLVDGDRYELTRRRETYVDLDDRD